MLVLNFCSAADDDRVPRSFGTWKIPVGDTTVDQVDQAISLGFSHIGEPAPSRLDSCACWLLTPPSFARADTAQSYRNEFDAGKAIKESGLARSDIFITTKYSGLGGLDIETSIKDSLKNVSAPCLYIAAARRADASNANTLPW